MDYLPNVSLKDKDHQLDLFGRTCYGITFNRDKCPICLKRPLGKKGKYWACKKCLKQKSVSWLASFLVENEKILFTL